MKRMLAFLILLIPCSGCMMIEDLLGFDEAPPGHHHYHATGEPPRGSCDVSGPNVVAHQTTEPELIQVRK